jgi:ABC-type sugar transport system substrate-binding protein
VDGGGDKAISRAATAAFLKSSRRQRKLLIVGINDESALGAVEAVSHYRGAVDAVVVGHGGSSKEMLDVIADRNSVCLGTVSFHAERYGVELLNFALPILQGKSAPTFHYVPHEFVGKNNLR